MSKYYEDGFIKGLTSGGYYLPDNWRTKISMLNLLSLLDCLQRADPENRPNQASDIQKVIQHVLYFLT